MTQTRILQAYTFILLVIRVVFLFQQKHMVVAQESTPIPPTQVEKNIAPQHSAAEVMEESGSLALGESQQAAQLLPADYIQRQSNVAILKQLYKQNPSGDILVSLIKNLLEQHRFDEAYAYVQESMTTYPGELDPYTHIYATFHAPSVTISQLKSISIVESLIETYRNQNLISADDYLFYQAMLKFWYNDFQAAQLLLQQIESPKYRDIKNNIINSFNTLSKQKDIPAYYTDAIISLTLMKNGYHTIAKKIATSVVLKDKSYILPYQILAYSHFMTQNWDTAIEYLLSLRDLESKQAQRYTFLVGVAHYWRGDYTQSILYLNQVTAAGLVADAYRYILLSYIQGGEYSRAHATRQKLLGNTDIIKNDFYSYFYNVFYEPIRHGRSWDMYTTNPTTASASIQQCFSVLATSDHDVCEYGNAGLAMVNNSMNQAKNILDSLVKKYDSPYLFHALADYYALNNQDIQAEQYYMQALQTTDDSEEKAVIQKKIIQLR